MRTPLVLAGEGHGLHAEYFEREIAPRLKGTGASWIGTAPHRDEVELLSNARCLLFPIQWEEPFGLAMIEAMLVGTPVIAFACGAASEIVEDGVTGYLVHSLEEMCQRIRDVAAIDRKACRARAQKRWSSARMAREYGALYLEAIDHWSATRSRRVVQRDQTDSSIPIVRASPR
jgi:glycosyltransferase involved in cell wall biosynthesis